MTTFTTGGTVGLNFTPFIYGATTTNIEVYIKNIQLEKGNKVSDWSSSPEDTNKNVEDSINNINIDNRNYLTKSDIKTSGGAIDITNATKIVILKGVKETNGINFNISEIIKRIKDNNSLLTLYFKYKKTGGTLTGLGGHTDGLLSKNKVYIDGKLSTYTFSDPRSCFVANDTNYHYVKVEFETPIVSLSGGVNLWIQPNRNEKTLTVDTNIEEILLCISNKDIGWTPAYEDVQNSIDNIQIGSRNYFRISTLNPYTPYHTLISKEGLNKFTLKTTGASNALVFGCTPSDYLYKRAIVSGRIIINGKPIIGFSNNALQTYRLTDSLTVNSEGYFVAVLHTSNSAHAWMIHGNPIKFDNTLTVKDDIIEIIDFNYELVESGNKATGWTPAHEDIEAQIKDQELYTEYSVNGTTAWHTPATSADRFMRQKKGDGAWGVALPFGKDGTNGTNGKDGATGAKGDKGDTGSTGAKGDKGNTGDRGPEGIQGPVGEPLGDGVMLFTDPDFSDGNNGINVYNNSANGNVTIDRIVKPSDAPSKSTHILRITNKGVASPALGGFYQHAQSRANAVFIHKIIAKIPTTHKLEIITNGIGNGGSTKFLTSQQGTGKYETYIAKIVSGTSGTFSVLGYFYLSGNNGTAAAPVIWDMCYSTIFDMSIPDKRLNFLTTTIEGNSVSTGTLRVGQGNAATAGITGVRASGATSNVSFWAGLTYENRESAPFQVWTDGRLKATNADITGKITATSGEFTGKVTATSGTFTGTVNANAGTFNNVTANNLTVNSGTFKGRIEAESGYFGGFLVNNQGMINDITKNDHKLEFGYQVAWTGIKSALGMNYKFMYSEGTNALVHNCNSQIVNTATTGTDHNVALLLTAARSAGGRNHALVIEKGDIAGMALYTKHFGVTDNIQIYRESVVIYTPINGSWICHVSLPTGEYRYDGRTVTIMCAGNGKTKIIGRDAVIYSHEGHHSVGKVDNYIDFFNNSSKVTMTYSAEKNWWFVTHINIH
ncbi:hypothetical protein AV926_17720 [Myroides marinus]|uniref:Uncharacterized protein n=1 Tax=Myroides marinus TaxID=703342 RepID=A0A163V5F3_9FLAO|nr:hypothetical protein [Myroides marinus]KZE74363.1 hypothetical protein AV926_17720 [Myroides marinus]